MDLNRRIDSSKYTDTVPEFPARVLGFHCLLRGMQAGAAFGLVTFPVYARMAKIPLSRAWRTILPVSTPIGGAAVFGYAMYKHWNDVDGVDDRAYRLFKSESQNRIDNDAGLGAGCGLLVGAVMGKGDIKFTVSALSTAMMVGTLTYMLENQYKKYSEKHV